MKDRFTPGISFLVALSLHLVVLFLVSRQYMAHSTNPSQLNQAARRLSTVNGQPVRFVYVKDMVPAKEAPADRSRVSDMNRRGASPSEKKGDSPDPASFGGSPIRQAGGPGSGRVTRPSVPGSMPSPPPSPPPSPGSQGAGGQERASAQARPEVSKPSPSSERPSRNSASKPSSGQGQQVLAQGQPVTASQGLPVGGETVAASAPSAPGGTPRPPTDGGPSGLGTQLQRMMVGSLQGGYDNPNASRLNTGALSFDTAAWDLGPYARRVQEKVQSNWHVPEAQMVLRQKGWVAIKFNVQKNGLVTDLQVVRSSGIPSYDQSAMDALRSSNPLPPLPEEVTVPQIGGLFRFFYNMGDEGD